MDDAPSSVHDAVRPYGTVPSEAPSSARTAPIERVTGIVGHTPTIRSLREQLARFAPTTATVVIYGETGTGKELVARALHALSPRTKRPFVAANVAALQECTLLSELFGHERGAFTGAHARHQGLFEQAHGGTLFLDEIGEMMPDAQAALLRVLETREVRPVGAAFVRKVDVRLVVATHRNLGVLVKHGLFREDLYYRLHTLLLRVPPLRHRVADLPALAHHLLAELAPEVGVRSLDRSALEALGEYGWPGNVRQLANVLRRAVVTTDAIVLTREHIRLALIDEPGATSEIEDGANVATITHVLAAERWNLTQAAKRLGIARSTLRTRIRRAGLVRDG
jgi:DNA-binding NtrC family response regulator